MNQIEQEVIAAFDAARPERLADLGGVDFLRGREEAVARVCLMPEILNLVLAEIGPDPVDGALSAFVVACAAVPVRPGECDPSAYKDAVEALAAADLPYSLAEQCQDVLARRAADRTEDEVVRWVALAACLQLAITHPDLRHDLLRVLARLKPEQHHGEFARRAAKVAGVAHSYWPDDKLLSLLEELASIPLARDEAVFELGMARLREGLDADSPAKADACFEEARGHFNTTLLAREYRPDAVAYSGALSMLTALRRGDRQKDLRAKAAEISKELTIAKAWSGQDRPAWKWMGARWTELVEWDDLAERLATVAADAAAAADPETELAIRQRLLGTYVANRTVLKRGAGGVETYVQPVIEARLMREETQRSTLSSWLSREAADDGSPWREAAGELLEVLRTRTLPLGKLLRTALQPA